MPPRRNFDSRHASRRQSDPALVKVAGRLMARGVPATTLAALVNQGKSAADIEALYTSKTETTEETA